MVEPLGFAGKLPPVRRFLIQLIVQEQLVQGVQIGPKLVGRLKAVQLVGRQGRAQRLQTPPGLARRPTREQRRQQDGRDKRRHPPFKRKLHGVINRLPMLRKNLSHPPETAPGPMLQVPGAQALQIFFALWHAASFSAHSQWLSKSKSRIQPTGMLPDKSVSIEVKLAREQHVHVLTTIQTVLAQFARESRMDEGRLASSPTGAGPDGRASALTAHCDRPL